MDLRRPQRRGPRGRAPAGHRDRGPGRRAGADARHPAGGLRPRVQPRGQLDPVVPAPPAVRHPEPAAVRPLVRRRLGLLPGLQRGVRRGPGRPGAGRPNPGRGSRVRRHPDPDPGLPPQPGPAAAAGPARRRRPRHRYRALPSHAVGTARLLPAAARPGGPGAARRHPRRGPRRLSRRAVGHGVPGLLRGHPRRGRGPDAGRRRHGRAGQLPGPRDQGGRAPAGRGRARAARPRARAGRAGSRQRAPAGPRRAGS